MNSFEIIAATNVTLTPWLDALRLSLHILSAAIWVGGQITLAGLLPTIRPLGPDATKKLANQFAKLTWPAYFVLVATGFWNLAALNPNHATTAWNIVLGVKIFLALLSGLSAFLHMKSTSKLGLALWGSIAGISSVATLILGIFISG